MVVHSLKQILHSDDPHSSLQMALRLQKQAHPLDHPKHQESNHNNSGSPLMGSQLMLSYSI